MSQKLNITVVSGSIRPGRQSERVVKFLTKETSSRGWKVNIVDPATTSPNLLTLRYMDYETQGLDAPQVLKDLSDSFSSSDAFIFCSPEYNFSLSPILANIVDHFKPEFARKPIGIVTYSISPFAGVRASVQLYSLIAGIGAVSVPASMPIPSVHELLNEEGIPQKEEMHGFAKNFLDELEWYTTALKNART